MHAGLELGTTNPEVRGAEGDVVVHDRHEQLVIGVLEDDPDTLADLAQVRLRDRQPGHPHLARPTSEDAVEVKDERRLARAVRPEERDALALVDREVDAEQRAVAIGIGEGDAADLKRWRAHVTTHAIVAIRTPTAGRVIAAVHWAAGAE